MISYSQQQTFIHRFIKSSVYFLCLVAFLSITKSAFAAICDPTYNPVRDPNQATSISFDLSSDTDPKQVCNTDRTNTPCFVIRACNKGMIGVRGCNSNAPYTLGNQQINGTSIVSTVNPGTDIRFWLEKYSRPNPRVCGTQEWEIALNATSTVNTCPNLEVVGISGSEEIKNYTYNNDLRVKIDARNSSGWKNGGLYRVIITQENVHVRDVANLLGNAQGQLYNQGTNVQPHFDIGQLGVGNYHLVITDTVLFNEEYCKVPFKVSENGDNTPDPELNLVKYKVCDQIPPTDPESKAACLDCQNRFGANGIWTAVGCVRTNATSIVRHFIQIGLGIAGGIALLMIIAAGFLLTTSQNDPKKVTEARELVTSAVIGLLFIVFSVTILQFIGVTILRIPGFGGQ